MTFRNWIRRVGLPTALAVGAWLVLGVLAPPASAGLAPGRNRLPVVLKGRDLLDWAGTKNLTHIYFYRYDPTASPPWIPIPFQIDKRRKINFIHNVGNPPGDPPGYPNPVPDDTAYDCALSYFPPRYCSTWSGPDYDGTVQECPSNYQAAFQSDLLGETDEIVFMARDLGTVPDTCPFDWPAEDPNLGTERLAIQVNDDGDSDGVIENGEKFLVYAYLWSATPPPGHRSTAPPPTWTANPSCTPCAGENVDQNVFHEDCGTFRGPASGGEREGYEIYAPSNWKYTNFRVIPEGGSIPHADILHSWNMSVPNETNQTWDCSTLPRPMDVKVPGPGEVRVIRGIQGAASGVATMKYDKAYDSVFETEVELRVHELGFLNMNQGHNAAVVEGHEAAVWAESVADPNPPPSPPTLKLWDLIDGLPPTTTPTPGADDWWQMIDSGRGGTASYTFADAARGPIPAMSESYNYNDFMSEPFGNFGRKWLGLSCLQDGNINPCSLNDGGCPSNVDPESPDLLFRRLIRVTIPTPASPHNVSTSVMADDFEFAVRNPLIDGTSGKELKDDICAGSPPPPLCTPTLGGTLQADGSVSLSASIGPAPECDSTAGKVGLTAQLGSGAETVIGYAPIGSNYRFRDRVFGVQHSFRAFAVAADGRVSAKSAPFSVTPADTTPPPPPIVESVQAVSGGVTLEYQTCRDDAALIVKLYLSETSGGPFTQANPEPLYVSGPHQVTIPGLANGTTYYGVMTMVDLSGNESAYSPQFSFTPGP